MTDGSEGSKCLSSSLNSASLHPASPAGFHTRGSRPWLDPLQTGKSSVFPRVSQKSQDCRSLDNLRTWLCTLIRWIEYSVCDHPWCVSRKWEKGNRKSLQTHEPRVALRWLPKWKNWHAVTKRGGEGCWADKNSRFLTGPKGEIRGYWRENPQSPPLGRLTDYERSLQQLNKCKVPQAWFWDHTDLPQRTE